MDNEDLLNIIFRLTAIGAIILIVLAILIVQA